MREKVLKWMKSSVFRMIIILCITIIPVNILAIVLGDKMIEGASRQVTSMEQNTFDLYMGQIDSAMKRVAIKLWDVSRENQNFLWLATKEVKNDKDRYLQTDCILALRNNFKELLRDHSLITGVYAYFPGDKIALHSNYAVYDQDIKEQIKHRVMQDSFSQGWEIISTDDYSALLFTAKYHNAYYGAWIDLGRLAMILGIYDSWNEAKTMFLMTDAQGKIIFPLHNFDENLSLNGKENWNYHDQEWTMIYAKSQISGFVLAEAILVDDIYHALPAMIRLLQAASMAALLILPIIFFALKRWFIAPLSRLSTAMKIIEDGDTEFRMQEEASGIEFTQINHNFNTMLDELKKLRIGIYEEQIKAQSTQMKFLSQQIQPHFILNTMNILFSYEKEEYEHIQEMILCLSQYFRYIVNANENFVKLRQEMEHIKNYFEIQRARYPKTFFAVVEYEDQLRNCLVPPLIIQNFAENIIKHSSTIDNKIDIFIVGQLSGENQLRIRIMDTGEGISQEILDKIDKFEQTGVYQEGLGVGIQNSIERLKFLYQDMGRINFARIEPHGTLVEILLPVQKSDDDEEDDDEYDFD